VTAVFGALMCFAQHHLKRLLAFSTVSHAGLMLIGVGLLSPHGIAGFALYAVGHGFAKGGLFLCAGIVLHRLQAIGESRLHGSGRGIVFTPILFLLGALALASMPPFLLLAGESAITDGAKLFGIDWVKWVFSFAGIVTAAAVLRFTFRTFYGWGVPSPLDHAAQVGEHPETEEEHESIPKVLFIPACLLIFASIGITFVPHIREYADAAAVLFTNESAYHSLVLDNAPVVLPPLKDAPPMAAAVFRGGIAGAVAVLLALATVFGNQRNWGTAFHRLECGWSPMRNLHSGHPSDYVAWLTFGTAVLGGCFVVLLR
jgi:multicomponent Na+:H+ antiporter subunit D